jgi:hypothetical protein
MWAAATDFTVSNFQVLPQAFLTPATHADFSICWVKQNIEHRTIQERGWESDTNVYRVVWYLAPGSKVLLEKLSVPHLVKKFRALYGIQWFVTVFTTAHHSSPSWASFIYPMPSHATYLRTNVILLSHLRLGLHRHPAFLFSHIHATCPACLILLDHALSNCTAQYCPYRLHKPAVK